MDPNFPHPSIETGAPPDPPPPDPGTTNTDGAALSDHLRRLSLGTASATPLPASSPARSPQKTPKLRRDDVSPNGLGVHHSPVRRSPSISSLKSDRRSSTPLLQNKRSVSSLHNYSGSTSPRPDAPRRVSSNLASSPTTSRYPRSSLASTKEKMEEKPLLTAATVANDHFKKEIEVHSVSDMQSKTVVLIHDACYGHRFSRPRTSKAALSTIVERPERVQAGILGLSAAYVRLAQRHAGGRHAPHPDLDPRSLPTPPFQIRKTARTIALSSPAVAHVHGQRWMDELKIMCDSAEGKLALNGKELVRPAGMGKEDDGTPSPKLHEGDLYLCSESLNAFEGALGGVCDGVDTIFGPGSAKRAFVCIRPPGHHCSSRYPSGFCWLNNVHVGIAHAAMTQGLTHAAIVDFDLHHGDGSQAIAWDHNKKASTAPKNAANYKKTPIGYFSLHDINSYPCELGDEEKVRNASLCIENAHGQSIWNVHLEPWKSHQDFWKLYETRYSILLDKARVFLRHHTQRLQAVSNGPRPKAAIFVSAGFDASEWEGAGMQRHKVNVPTDFYARFTMDVVRLAEEEGLGVDGRVISVLEGGYSNRALTSGVLSHLCGLTHRNDVNEINEMDVDSGLASEMRKRLGIAEQPNAGVREEVQAPSFDAGWWAAHSLEELELLVHPPAPAAPSKKLKEKAPGNYSSPTQSFTAKIVTPPKAARRSVSGASLLDSPRHSVEPEEPEIPPPEVDWATAAHQLSKVLIPTDRQIESCKYEDLNAEATRARRERQSAMGVPSNDLPVEKRMQLRDRKAKPPPAVKEETSRPSSRANRRTTIAAVGDLPDPGVVHGLDGVNGTSLPANPQRRRLSAASSITSSVSGVHGDGRESVEPGLSYRTSSEANSQSRAGSVISEKPPAPVVKKSRAVSGPKAAPSKRPNSPKKTADAPPVPRVPSSYQNQFFINPNAPAGTSTDHKPSRTAITKSISGSDQSHDVDDLTAGLKKIKLKVPSPEENAAREKKTAEEKKVKPKAPRRQAAPKTTKTISPKPIGKAASAQPPKQQPSVDVPSSNVAMVPEQPPTSVTPAAPGVSNAVPSTLTSLPINTNPESTINAPAGQTLNGAFAQPPVQSPVPAPAPAPTEMPREQLSALFSPPLPPTEPKLLKEEQKQQPVPEGIQTTPKSAKKTKADLPVFTSSSPIPFGKQNGGVVQSSTALATVPIQSLLNQPTSPTGPLPSSQQEVKQENIVPSATSDVPAPQVNMNGHDHLPFQQQVMKQEILDSQQSNASIWDVPDTPRH